MLINHVDLLHFGQCCGFLQGSILVAFGVANLCQTWTISKRHSTFLRTEFFGDGFFRDTPRQQFSICVPSHGRTSVCTHPAAPSLHTWISSLKRCLTVVFVKSSRSASRDRSFCNEIPLVNFGLEILSRSGLKDVANDKDGFYSLVDPNVLTNIHLPLLMNGQYFETDFTNWDRKCAKASLTYSILCKRVEDLEQEPELARELRKSLTVPVATTEVQLVTSCKSHKPPGAVNFRNIHSAPCHAFAGLAIWSASQH